jgi:hypothetical protein
VSELDVFAPDQVRLTYWVDFIHPVSRSRIWSNALRDESEEKAWASVKQLRSWYYAHRVSVLRYDPAGSGRTGLLRAAEWDRSGIQVARMEELWDEFPEWMLRDVIEEDREAPPTRGVT